MTILPRLLRRNRSSGDPSLNVNGRRIDGRGARSASSQLGLIFISFFGFGLRNFDFALVARRTNPVRHVALRDEVGVKDRHAPRALDGGDVHVARLSMSCRTSSRSSCDTVLSSAAHRFRKCASSVCVSETPRTSLVGVFGFFIGLVSFDVCRLNPHKGLSTDFYHTIFAVQHSKIG